MGLECIECMLLFVHRRSGGYTQAVCNIDPTYHRRVRMLEQHDDVLCVRMYMLEPHASVDDQGATIVESRSV